MTNPLLVLVPREPTEAMCVAGGYCGGFEFDGESGTIYPAPIWRAMVAAFEASAPPPLRLAERTRAEEQRDIAVAALEQVRFVSHTAHWDKTGGSGAGCPACIEQRETDEKIKSALARIAAIGEAAPAQAAPGASAMEIAKRFVSAYVHSPARKNFEDGEDNCLISFVVGYFEQAIEQAEREARAAARDWQPIERAPTDGTFVLTALASGLVLILQFCSEGYWRRNAESAARFHPTHWMPLPAPPAGETSP